MLAISADAEAKAGGRGSSTGSGRGGKGRGRGRGSRGGGRSGGKAGPGGGRRNSSRVGAPPPEPVPLAPDQSRLQSVLNAGQRVNQHLERLITQIEQGADVQLLDELKVALSLVVALVREACANCDEHAAELASVANAMKEEWNDVDVRNGIVVERQRVLSANGLEEDARLLNRAARAEQLVTAALVHLHEHTSHARPERALVQPDMLQIAATGRTLPT